ncbi:MAG: glucosidase [Frankiales bacterium]|nr:glucosidase [Frankiales bacterium]
MDLTVEEQRLREAREGVPWRQWGPYLSERQWGTVREDYSDDGDAWSYFSHDAARSRAYRWGEDGLAGVSDDKGLLCLALALWNGADPILKERLFGLTNQEGNHGEDVKEYYFYVDNTPTHSWMRWRYRYPQAAYPYDDLVRTNAQRGFDDSEYELIDTGVFDDDRYFDVEVDYAKAAPDDLVARITVRNRGADPAPIDVVPTLWFRNTWSWGRDDAKPSLRAVPGGVHARHGTLGDWYLHVPEQAQLMFTENETNNERLFGTPSASPFVKDGIGRAIVQGEAGAVRADSGTKAGARLHAVVPAHGEVSFTLRLSRRAPGAADPGPAPDDVLAARAADADQFYAAITPPSLDADTASVMRQALAGMLWTKQHYYFDLDVWLREHGGHPLRPPTRPGVRNASWFHMVNDDIISMPDKWEYPWYAAWDLAFHTVALAMVDPDFAKDQLDLMLSSPYLHPTGQIPAYEWNFSDVNPPVHAWALALVYGLERHMADDGTSMVDADDVDFLAEAFGKLLLNFTWWVNRKDPSGRNVFQGGFLGLDNIGVFDRSQGVPSGGTLEQSDGTAWMAFFSQNMLELAIALSEHDDRYQTFIVKFVHHFFQIALAMDPLGDNPDEMWDEQDGFFYDVLRMPDGTGRRIEVRSLVGLLPLCATSVVPAEVLDRFPDVLAQIRDYLARNGDLLTGVADPTVPGVAGRRLLALVNEDKLRRILASMLDEERFLGPHGIRSVSKWHEEHPYVFEVDGASYTVAYESAESRSGMFGGNSNWRGPVWFPVNVLLVRALLQFYLYYGDDFRVECPTGSGRELTLFEVAEEISARLVSTFRRDEAGRRPVFGGAEKFQNDPVWNQDILFYEYFDGDDGAGIGASHQTGWTGVVARLAQLFASTDPHALLEGAARPLTVPYRRLMDAPMPRSRTIRR